MLNEVQTGYSAPLPRAAERIAGSGATGHGMAGGQALATGQFLATGKRYEARIATDAETRLDAYRLRYRCYHADGYIDANPERIFRDKYDDLPTASTIVVYTGGKAVASVRMCLLRPGPGTLSPARDSYPEAVEAALRDAAVTARPGEFVGGEVNRLVRAPESADDQGLVFMLFRLAGQIALDHRLQVVISCVRRNHSLFYSRVGFKDGGAEPKIYPGLTCPMSLMISPKKDWDATRASFRLMDPEAGPAGLLAGLGNGETVYPNLMRAASADDKCN